MENTELIQRAIKVLNPRKLSSMDAEAGGVGAALLTKNGNIFTGVCIDVSSGMSMCAEHAAIAGMVTAGETNIKKIVAVNWDEAILPPCGVCREFIHQIDDDNENCEVIMPENQTVYLKEILPFHWHKYATGKM